MPMVGILNMLARRSQTEASLDMTRRHFRKSSDSPRRTSQDVDSTEDRRKAAAWQWYQRGRGSVYPTRKTVVLEEAAGHRDCGVERPLPRFKAEATEERSGYNSSSKSTQDCETNLFDASELSSIAERVQLLVRNLKIEGASLQPGQRDGTADIQLNEHNIQLNEHAVDDSSTSDRSQPRRAQCHQQPTEKEEAFDVRSLSDLPYSHQLHQETSEGIEIHSGAAQSSHIAEKDRLYGNADITMRRKSSSFRSPFSVVRKFFQGTFKWSGYLCTEVNEQEQIHHHYYHHHHIYYHHKSGEELQSPDINAKTRPPRRMSESFTVHTEGGLLEPERRRDRRHSLDVAATYRLDCSGDDARDARDYLCRPAGGDEGLVQARAH